ncbi:hypothetical protein ACLOJK_003919 [Asimina triloba]
MSRLLPKPCAIRAKRDKTVDSATTAKEEALRFSTDFVALRSEAEALCARNKASCAELKAVRGEVTILGSREAKFLAESKAIRVQVAWVWMKLEMSRADLGCLQSIFGATFSGVVRSSSDLTTPKVGIEREYLWCRYGDEASRGSTSSTDIMMMDQEGVPSACDALRSRGGRGRLLANTNGRGLTGFKFGDAGMN